MMSYFWQKCFLEVLMKPIPSINIGDTLELKKQHPCGCKLFRVIRVGSDVRIVCTGCNKSLILDRVKLEKMIKNIISGEN